MNLNQFEYLLTVYQEKSITKAAQKLFVSAPAISTAVKQMEEELGYSILIRQPNGIVFTEKGEYAITVIQDIQKRISYLYQLKGDLLDIQGEYIIGGTIHFNNAFLTNFLLHMNQKYSHLRLNLQSSDSESIISGIGTGLLDIGMIIMTQIDEANLMREIYRNQLDYLKIASDEMCFVVRKDHPILSENELNLEKLFTYPYICYLENLKGFEPYFFATLLLNQTRDEQNAIRCAEKMKMLRINDSKILYKILEYINGFTIMPHLSYNYLEKNHPELQYLNLHDDGLKCDVVLLRKSQMANSIDNLLWTELKSYLQETLK